MVTSPGTCDAFVRTLRRSNLIDASRLEQVIGGYMRVHFHAEPSGLANHLVSEEILTAFQAERLLKGDTQDLVLGPYVLMDLAGFGSMGPVYKALSKNDNRWYAVKVLPRRNMWNVLLAKRQARAFDKIQHPGIVPFADIGTAGSQHYLVWPFCEGEALDKIVEREGKLPSGLVAHYGYQIAEALFVCHQQDLFHGMLKPSNVMVDAEHHIHLLDFGVGAIFAANPEDQSLFNTQGQANLTTSGLDCASPESISDSSHLDAVGDQYSLGCILYFCLADRFPFEGQPVEKMVAHQTKRPPPLAEFNPDVRRELAVVVARLMQKSPQARYVDAAEAARALRPMAFVPTKRSVPLAPIAPLPRPSTQAPKLPTRETTADEQITKDTKEMLPPSEVTPQPPGKEISPPFISSLPQLNESPSAWAKVLHLLRLLGTCLAILSMLFLAWWFFWRK
jgi:serine/threonine-protein kinase